ncbi:uncharacterized protein Camp isoform X2 [Drosophila bipectinata]|uniref:uncharacterized protein Camp isoform X2 n=1 Tax=Drosophila bipectinata TaxID=42026 RepID=UPI0007E5E04F|nr:uncharacterized protein LOC108133176 isoform X2 [Drosophila bipectinata]
MSLTITNYKKPPGGVVPRQTVVPFRPKTEDFQRIPKLEPGITPVRGTSEGVFLNQIPVVLRPTMKRASTTVSASTTPITSSPEILPKTPKYTLNFSSSSSPASSSSSVQWKVRRESQSLGVAINSLPPNTIIKATTRPAGLVPATSPMVTSPPSTPASSRSSLQSTPTVSAVRQAVFIKRELPQPQRTMRSLTLSLVEHAPMLHLGVAAEHLPLLKRHICRTANITHLDCYITLRKLRQNEPFALLAEHFEVSEADAKDTFKRTLIKLARCMRTLIRWPDAQHYQERLKHTPIDYRATLLHVRSLIECVETDVDEEFRLGSSTYKFILCINTNSIISYVSSVYPGNCDDLQLFEASNFRDVVPKYLTLCAEPGKAVKRTRRIGTDDDSGDEEEFQDGPAPSLSKYHAQRLTGRLASQQSLSVVDGALVSKRAASIQLPTLKVQEPACRAQMRNLVDGLREFRMLGHSAIDQKSLLGYLDEMLIVACALCNLKRQELHC